MVCPVVREEEVMAVLLLVMIAVWSCRSRHHYYRHSLLSTLSLSQARRLS